MLLNSFIECFKLNPDTFLDKAVASIACVVFYVTAMYGLFCLWTIVDKYWTKYESNKKPK